jgi:hypothetical protein
VDPAFRRPDFRRTLEGMNELPGALHGAITYSEARRELGERRLRSAVDSGALVGFGRGVLLDARRVLDVRTRAAGALLLTGGTGVLVGPTAAMLHGCTATGGFPVHVLVPHHLRMRSRVGLIVRQGRIRQEDVLDLDGLPVHRLELVLGELLRTAPRRAALACTDQALRALPEEQRPRLLTRIRQALAEAPDRRGIRRADTLLSLATGRPSAPAESALLLVLADAGLPVPICGYKIDGRPVTFAWPDRNVALRYHGRRSPPPTDLVLARRGWRVVTAGLADLDEPTALFRRLRTALHRATAAA